jgi:large subunit ribosomal protein L25
VAELILHVKTRKKNRKSDLTRIRSAKEVPAVVYGKGKEPKLISFKLDQYSKLRKGHGQNQVFSLVFDDNETASEKVIIREAQRDIVRKNLIHVDFLGLEEGHKVSVKVPVHFVGEAYGVKNEAGILQHVLRNVLVEALPANIPERIVVDVTDVRRGEAIYVRDIKPEGYEIKTPGNLVIGTIKGTKTIEEEEAEAAAAAAAAAEGEPVEGEPVEGEEAEKEAKDEKEGKAEKEEKAGDKDDKKGGEAKKEADDKGKKADDKGKKSGDKGKK